MSNRSPILAIAAAVLPAIETPHPSSPRLFTKPAYAEGAGAEPPRPREKPAEILVGWCPPGSAGKRRCDPEREKAKRRRARR